MAVAMVNKFLGMLGMGPEGAEAEDLVDEVDEVEAEEENEGESRGFWGIRGSSKVVAMPQTSQKVKMVISRPTNIDDAFYICDLLRERNSVIINLEYVNNDDARRIIDVVQGATRVLDGTLQKISSTICVVAPVTYDVTNDAAKDDIKNKVSMSAFLGANE